MQNQASLHVVRTEMARTLETVALTIEVDRAT
jgi:hypothetical protein